LSDSKAADAEIGVKVPVHCALEVPVAEALLLTLDVELLTTVVDVALDVLFTTVVDVDVELFAVDVELLTVDVELLTVVEVVLLSVVDVEVLSVLVTLAVPGTH
jgi:hypothetical protein